MQRGVREAGERRETVFRVNEESEGGMKRTYKDKSRGWWRLDDSASNGAGALVLYARPSFLFIPRFFFAFSLRI